jgi:two-component system chemotaxis response regulator CheY
VTDKAPPTYHFLVVDDDNDSRNTMVEYLKSMGYDKITSAKDGAEAARKLEQDTTINFIISDWEMPLMNGLTLLQRVRAQPDRAGIPFLIATSPVSQEQEKVVLAAENMVNAYVIKPFRMQTFKEKIDRLMELATSGRDKITLVIDDDDDARAMVVEYLKQLGFVSIVEHKDGKAGLTWLVQNSGRVGMIISDWEMPQMNGIELLKACKANQGLAEIPFLMITSQSSMERMKVMQAARANVDEYLLKPFTGADLKKRISTVIERARSRGKVAKIVVEAIGHMDGGRFQKAKDLFETAYKVDPENDVVLRGLGDAVWKVKGVDAAIPFYRKSVEVAPVNSKGYLKLAQAYEHVGWLDKAVALLQTANSQISFSAELHYQLGWVYHKKGMIPQAKLEFEKTLEIQIDHQEARLMLEMIGSGRTS